MIPVDAGTPACVGVELASRLVAAHRSLPEPARSKALGLCLSGGLDSCALALSVAAAREDLGTEIVALHARHGLRGSESDGDALSVRELCARLGLALVEVDATVSPGPNLEARARASRYSALRRAFPGLLVTAHHRGDQAETVVLRLLRGAGPTGLRGIHGLREDGVWRPFLDVPRRALEDVCRQAGWVWREDSSNRDQRLLRNWIRHAWLPQGGDALERSLAAVATAASALAPSLEERLESLGRSCGLAIDPTGFRLDLRPWHDQPDHPELDLLLELAWTRCGRRPWAEQQRRRLVSDVLTGASGRRRGGQGEMAFWGGGVLQVRGSVASNRTEEVESAHDG